MAKPHKTLSKTESAIQLGNILKYGAGGRGGASGGIIKNIKKLLKIKPKATTSASPITEVKKAKTSLKNQKVNKSAKVSGRDAVVYGQPTKHGSPIGQRGLRTLAEKHPEAAMNKRIPAGTIAQGGTKIRNTGSKSNPEASSPHYKLRVYKKDGSWNKEHVLKKDKSKTSSNSSYKKIIKENRLGRFKGKK